jgi:uncharacterized protein YggE
MLFMIWWRRMSVMRLLPLLVMLSSTLALAQESQDRPTVVRATAEAAVSVRVQEARLRVAIVTTGGTAERARERNAERATTVIARLRDVLGPDANIRTASLSVTQKYPDGFMANNTIEAHAGDPVMAGKAIDAATRAGASVLGGVEASAMDEQDARAEALKEATVRARANAEAIAAALGTKVIRVISAETSALPVTAPSVPSAPHVAAKKRSSVPTPVISGNIEVRAQVTVSVQVAP